MKYLSKMKTAAVTAAVILVSFVFLYAGTTGFWDMGISDRLNQRESVTNKKIYIIGIDDKTLEQYGPVNTWSREIPAKLVSLLNGADGGRPAVIGFDVIYSEEADQEADDSFARACKEAGNVVAAMSFSFKEQPEKGEDGRILYNPYHVDYVIAPYDSLKKEVICGFANTFVDTDGYVRQAMAYLDHEGVREYSLSSQVYKIYQESRGEEAVFPAVYGRNNRFYFTYSGKAGGYSVISMADVLDGTVDPAIFRDAVVLVGAYAVGMQDSYMPAIAHNSQMYGVEIHANIIEALLEGKTQLPVSPLGYAFLTAFLCGAFYICSDKIRMLYVTVLMAVLLALDVIFVKVMYGKGWIVPVILWPVCLLIIYLAQMVRKYLAEIMRRRRVLNVFKQYVAPQVVDKISKDKDFELVIGGENRHIAVLFVDIRGFTTMSESLQPEEVVEILNEYLGLTTQAIFDNGGTLDKFVGDATMAVFNAPFDLDDYIFRAVSTAWDMQAGADRIAEKFRERYGKSVSFGIGVNCGNAVVGNIGCDFRMDYTAIGDTVNTAARLESNAKPGQILISSEVYEAVKDRVTVTPIGEIPLKGKNKGVFVYQVDDVKKQIGMEER
ncbi:MAG: adenylate/guanylate cyclase domain-containing protein [Lachnospiraceae bacterium]|nr:adenylate/guanylate cyclase domain-containing protein [Lachnospiraceae bacterium]